MYKKEITEIENFCIVPFSELNIDANGLVRSCCVQDDSQFTAHTSKHDTMQSLWADPQLQSVRDDFLNNKKHKSCEICWKNEHSGVQSERQRRNQDYIRNYQQLEIENPSLPTTLDLRLSNKCNLKCRMCSEKASNQIAKELFLYDMDVIEVNEQYIYQNLKNLKQLKLLGGEPTLIPQCHDILHQLIACGNTNLRLHITTNATTSKQSWYTLVKQFSDVTWAFSIDSVGKTNDYIRSNSNYQQLLDNIKKYREFGQDLNWKYTTSQTIQLYNLHDYHELESQLSGLIDEYHYGMVTYPDFLSIDSLPMALKQKYKHNHHNPLVTSSLNTVITDEKAYLKMWEFVTYTNRLDTIRGTRFSDINPELWQDINDFLHSEYNTYAKTIKERVR